MTTTAIKNIAIETLNVNSDNVQELDTQVVISNTDLDAATFVFEVSGYTVSRTKDFISVASK